MGGYRGYGSTHSQSLETLFFNIPNVIIYSPNIFSNPRDLLNEILNKDKSKLINESADLIYHLVAAWVYCGVNPNEVWTELWNRNNFSKKRETNDL